MRVGTVVSEAAAPEVSRLLRNWRAELDSAALYDALAQRSRDSQQRAVYQQLTAAERRHAAFWEERLRSAGQRLPAFRTSARTRILIALVRCLGGTLVIPSIIVREMNDRDGYRSQNDALVAGLAQEEHGHAALLRGATDRAFGQGLRAAVLGANDGLTSIFCLMMGVAGSGAAAATIMLAGVAGLVSGAGAMAMGEWLSVTNARELASSQIAREAQEIEQTPQAEQHELALIYQAKGLPKADAQRIAAELMTNKQAALDTLAREELGIDPAELGGNPYSAAATSFALFSAGAIFPVVPFLWVRGLQAIVLSIALSVIALGGIGLLTSLFNGRPPWFSALRQVLSGCAAAAVTYGIGSVLGVSIS